MPTTSTRRRSSARANFVRVANTRTNKALDEIRKIGRIGMASDDRYEYGPADVRKIINALQRAVDDCKAELLHTRQQAPQRLSVVAE